MRNWWWIWNDYQVQWECCPVSWSSQQQLNVIMVVYLVDDRPQYLSSHKTQTMYLGAGAPLDHLHDCFLILYQISKRTYQISIHWLNSTDRMYQKCIPPSLHIYIYSEKIYHSLCISLKFNDYQYYWFDPMEKLVDQQRSETSQQQHNPHKFWINLLSNYCLQ